MDKLINFVTTINIDAILSDPLLLVRAILLILVPIFFLIALWKFVRLDRRRTDFVVPHHDEELESTTREETESLQNGHSGIGFAPSQEPTSSEPIEEIPERANR